MPIAHYPAWIRANARALYAALDSSAVLTGPAAVARVDARRSDLDAFMATGRFPGGTIRTVRRVRTATDWPAPRPG